MKKMNLFAGAAFGLAILGAFAFKTAESNKQATTYYYKLGAGPCNVAACSQVVSATPCRTEANATFYKSIAGQPACNTQLSILYKP